MPRPGALGPPSAGPAWAGRGLRARAAAATAQTVFTFGCYLGEVMFRHAGYRWVDTPPGPARNLGPLAVCRTADSGYANPIGTAVKRVDNGAADSVAYFNRVFTTTGGR